MGAYLLGTAGFLLYFIYDVNSILWKNSGLQKLFAAGSLCVAAASIWFMLEALPESRNHPLVQFLLGTAAFLFFILLIYTLFFALPFEETYLRENRERLAFTKGVYSLCRHPGVLWFAGLYLCLWGMTGVPARGIFFLSMIFWNYLYIVFQDLWTFPRTFCNYNDYKKNTPFLLPNRRSIQACLMHKKCEQD